MDSLDESLLDNEENEELTTAAQVVEKLEEVWVNERLAPELLHYENELVECLLDQIQHMERSLQTIRKEDFRIIFHKMEIEKFAAHLLHEESQDSIVLSKMSREERAFAESYFSNLKNYLQEVGLKKMPLNMQSLKYEEVCCKPQMDRSVFIRVKKECNGILIEESTDTGEEEIVDLTPGSQHILKYKPIASLVKNGAVQLI